MTSRVSLSGGIAVLAVAGIFFAYSLQYPYESELGPGSGMLPLWLSGFLIILAIAWIVLSLRGKDSSEAWLKKTAQNEILFILAAMSAFVLFLPWLGFNVTSTAFLFVFLRRTYVWYKSLSISAGASLLLFLLFTQGFSTPMPINSLGF